MIRAEKNSKPIFNIIKLYLVAFIIVTKKAKTCDKKCRYALFFHSVYLLPLLRLIIINNFVFYRVVMSHGEMSNYKVVKSYVITMYQIFRLNCYNL